MLSGIAALCLGAAGALAGAPAGGAASGLTSEAAFERLKGLSGTWSGTIAGGGQPAKVVYRTVAGGSAVMETLFPGTGEEMISVYFRDGEELRMTHYCAAGNQPRLRLDRKASSTGDLVFGFDGGTNLDPKVDMHIHSGHLLLKEGGSLEAAWDFYKDGKAAGQHRILFTERTDEIAADVGVSGARGRGNGRAGRRRDRSPGPRGGPR
jgi:hypothetical protein